MDENTTIVDYLNKLIKSVANKIRYLSMHSNNGNYSMLYTYQNNLIKYANDISDYPNNENINIVLGQKRKRGHF